MEVFPLLELPELVCINIAEFASLHTQLALRQVCRQTKSWTERISFGRSKNISNIPFPLSCFSPFMESGLRFVTYFYIENSSPEIFKNVGMSLFLQVYGASVQKLKVKTFYGCVSQEEFEFYESLKSLQELEIEFALIANDTPENAANCRIPKNFKNLKVLKIHKLNVTEWRFDFDYLWELLTFCNQVETLMKPQINDHPGIDSADGKMSQLKNIMKERRSSSYPVKFIDMRNYLDPENFLNFEVGDMINQCSETGTKLTNVDATLFKIGFMPAFPHEHFADTIISLQNIPAMVNFIELPFIQEINVKSVKECLQDAEEAGGGGDADLSWPDLEVVKVHFDSDTSDPHQRNISDDVVTILFRDWDRSSVKDLSLSFERNRDKETFTNCLIPNFASAIAENHTGLRSLTIQGWDGQNKSFVKLWKELLQLEELSIEDCRALGNVGFIGTDEANPVFLKLNALKKLKLGRLDEMPKITDRFLRDVLRNMKLKELKLTSYQPLNKITKLGIEALANSPVFANSIQKFSFKHWSLKNMKQFEFHKLRNLFECNI